MSVVKIILKSLLALVEIAVALIESVMRIIAGLLGILRVRLHKSYDYRHWLKRDLEDCQTILELGCGSNSPLVQTGISKRTTAVDIWEPYIEKHTREKNYYEVHRADILTMPLGRKIFDAVVMCDVLEHLPIHNGTFEELMEKVEGCARKKVILFTPNGNIPNDEVDGDPFQKHQSAWEPIDYQRLGYEVHGATGLRYILGKGARPKYHPYSVMEIIAMLSQPVIFNRPEMAIHSYAVKELN